MNRKISELARSAEKTLMKLNVMEIYDLLETIEEGVIDTIIHKVLRDKALEAGVCPECDVDCGSELEIVFSDGKTMAICDYCGFRLTIAEKKESDV